MHIMNNYNALYPLITLYNVLYIKAISVIKKKAQTAQFSISIIRIIRIMISEGSCDTKNPIEMADENSVLPPQKILFFSVIFK